MKKLLLLLLIVGCDNSTESEHTHNGVCVYKAEVGLTNQNFYYCYGDIYDEEGCMENKFETENACGDYCLVMWFPTIDCVEFCSQTELDCTIF